MENPLREEVLEAFAPEIECGLLSIGTATYHPQAFGNSSVVLEGSEFRVKLLVERGEPYAFLAPTQEPERWAWLQFAIRALEGRGESDNSERPDGMQIDARGAASMLRHHFSELAEAFGTKWRTTLPVLTEIEDAYQKQMMRWLGSPEASVELAQLNKAAAEALENPSDALKAALESLGLDK